MEYPSAGTRVLRSASEHGRWEMLLRAAPPALRGVVRGFCLYRQEPGLLSTHRQPPHRDVTFIVSLDGALEVRDPRGDPQVFAGGRGFLAGIHTAPAFTDFGTPQRGVEVMLAPLGARLLLGGMPMDAVSNRVLPLDDLLGAAARTLGERLGEAPDAARAFALLETFFARRIPDAARGVPPELREAWRLLEASHGAVRIGDIAARLGWSRKRLVAAFRAWTGHPPKTLARVLRFDRAMRMLAAGPHVPWSEVALACGYHDQAHLTREVRELSGSTPGALARGRDPDTGALAA